MTNPLKSEHALDWSKTAHEIEDQFQAVMIERDRYMEALEKIIAFNDSEMGDGDGARLVATEALRDA